MHLCFGIAAARALRAVSEHWDATGVVRTIRSEKRHLFRRHTGQLLDRSPKGNERKEKRRAPEANSSPPLALLGLQILQQTSDEQSAPLAPG